MAKKVIATQLGYYGALREPGAIFDVPDDEPDSIWFEPYKEPKEDKASGKKAKGGTDDLA